MQEQCVAIVTCVQNKSDAIAEQFGANIAVLPFIAVDSVTRMGDTAARFTLGEQVQRDPATVLQTREAARALAIHTALAAALRAREGARFPSDRPFQRRPWADTAATGSRPSREIQSLEARFQACDPWQRWWFAFVWLGRRDATLVADIAARRERAEAELAQLKSAIAAAEQRLLDSARAFLCTVDYAGNLLLGRLSAGHHRPGRHCPGAQCAAVFLPRRGGRGGRLRPEPAEPLLAHGRAGRAAGGGAVFFSAAGAGRSQRGSDAPRAVPDAPRNLRPRLQPVLRGQTLDRGRHRDRPPRRAGRGPALDRSPRSPGRGALPCRRRNPAEAALLAEYFLEELPRILEADHAGSSWWSRSARGSSGG